MMIIKIELTLCLLLLSHNTAILAAQSFTPTPSWSEYLSNKTLELSAASLSFVVGWQDKKFDETLSKELSSLGKALEPAFVYEKDKWIKQAQGASKKESTSPGKSTRRHHLRRKHSRRKRSSLRRNSRKKHHKRKKRNMTSCPDQLGREVNSTRPIIIPAMQAVENLDVITLTALKTCGRYKAVPPLNAIIERVALTKQLIEYDPDYASKANGDLEEYVDQLMGGRIMPLLSKREQRTCNSPKTQRRRTQTC